jgi:hypothetical protein
MNVSMILNDFLFTFDVDIVHIYTSICDWYFEMHVKRIPETVTIM